MNRQCRDIIALSMVPGLGPRGIAALLKEAHGEAGEIFRMSRSRLRCILPRNFDRYESIRSADGSDEYRRELAYIEKEGIHPVCLGHKDYPGLLKNICDPPAVLYCKGLLRPCEADAVAIVGSRKCSLYGLQMAEKLAAGLAARGITVISGMARGIDTAAHRGSLKAGGRTIAVMGSGFRHPYPSGSEKLIEEISANGAVLTEYTSDIQPGRETFPRRNRIISGMARGVVVVEAARKSGAMITVNMALEQGREVFAVPGRADFYTSSGTNFLIQSGAKLVTNVDDILEELNIGAREIYSAMERDPASGGTRTVSRLNEEEQKVLEMLRSSGAVHLDSLSEHTGIGPGMLPRLLLGMEVNGLVKASAGGNYVLCEKSVQ